jgi:hypothetical protein
MKAEERKALETNTLAKELGKVVEGIKKGPSRSTMVYVGVIVAVLFSVFLFRYFWRSSESTTSQRWLELDEVIFQEQLNTLLSKDDLKGTPQGRAALFKEARLLLMQGMRDYASSPGSAREFIEKGTEKYEELVKTSSRTPLLHQEALAGAAKGNEALGNIDKAEEFYQRLVKEYPVSTAGKDAKKQLDRLGTPSGRKDAEDLARSFSPPKK